MAKKYVCKVCGYVHEGNEAPAVCPQCKQSNCFELQKKSLDTNSNVYTIVYATVIVVVVALLLAVVSSVLRPKQDANRLLDTKKQILVALNQEITPEAEQVYADIVKDTILVGECPVFVAQIEGQTKYVLKLHGVGLWGAIWGYVALDNDKNTIFGINFGHESETPGLGGEITTENFRSRFFGKHILGANGELRSIAVMKAGQKTDNQEQVDAWAGATITSKGVEAMLLSSLTEYAEFLTGKAVENAPSKESADEVVVAEDIENPNADAEYDETINEGK